MNLNRSVGLQEIDRLLDCEHNKLILIKRIFAIFASKLRYTLKNEKSTLLHYKDFFLTLIFQQQHSKKNLSFFDKITFLSN